MSTSKPPPPKKTALIVSLTTHLATYGEGTAGLYLSSAECSRLLSILSVTFLVFFLPPSLLFFFLFVLVAFQEISEEMTFSAAAALKRLMMEVL